MRHLYTVLSVLLLWQTADAQFDLQCSGRDKHSLYFVDINSSYGFYRIDSVDTHPTAPIFVDSNLGINAQGISINKNLNGLADTSVYIVDNYREYQYFDGTYWVHTGHYAGPSASGAVNIGGTDEYIFNFDGVTHTIYRYDGTANDTPLVTGVPDVPRIFDIATDMDGNFYLFNTSAHQVLMYNADGIPVDSLTTTGNTEGYGGGFAILGHRMYYVTGPESGEPHCILYEGIVTGGNIDFNPIDTISTEYVLNDVAACPNAAEPLAVFEVPEAPHFIIFPNPAANSATIKLNNAASMEVHDGLGRLMFTTSTVGRTEYSLSLAGYSPGIYFVTVHSPNGLMARRTLVVQ